MSVPADTPAQPPSQSGGRDRFLIAIVGGTIFLVVAAIAVVFLVGRDRTPVPADPNSPAGVVQTYIGALRSGEVERARGLLTRQARAQAEARDRQNSYRPSPSGNDNVRIVVQTVSTTDTTAEVKVTISRFYARSDPFSSGTSHYDVSMKLVREDGAWRISEPIEPYPYF